MECCVLKMFEGLDNQTLCVLLGRIKSIRAGLLGDICLDVYWEADMRLSELSKETPHFPLPVIRERTSPGAGGNVAMNLAALGVKMVQVISVVGNDWRGDELCKCFEEGGIGSKYILRDSSIVTNAYIKPLRSGISDVTYEDPRIDFSNYAPISVETENRLIEALDAVAPELDVLCVSDQFRYGVVSERVQKHLKILADQGLIVIADSRYNIGRFQGIYLKPNSSEALAAVGYETREEPSIEVCVDVADKLVKRGAHAVVMTIGAKGSLFYNGEAAILVPAHKVSGPVDICGAGDTFLSGFAAALAAQATPCEAAALGGLCSEITIRQLGTTGTASPTQISQWHNQINRPADAAFTSEGGLK